MDVNGMVLELGEQTVMNWAGAGMVSEALQFNDFLLNEKNHTQQRYTKGLLLREYMGAGKGAAEAFEQAASDSTLSPEIHAAAIENRCLLSISYEDFFYWLSKLEQVDPQSAANLNAQTIKSQQESGMSWSDTRRFYADRAYNDRRFGIAASSLQLALYSDDISRRSKPDIIKGRIWALREIDISSVNQLGGGQEVEPEDRPTLATALKELSDYLETDPYDANLWNSRGMWEYELNRVNDAIASLEKALELKQWSKPYGNLARCHAEAGNFQEARNCSNQCSQRASNDSEKRFSQKVSQFLNHLENEKGTTTKGSIEDLYESRKQVWYQTALTEISQLGVHMSRVPNAIEKVVAAEKNLTEEQMADILSFFTPWVLAISWMNDREQRNLIVDTVEILSMVGSRPQNASIVAKSACWLLALWVLSQNTISSSKKRLEILKDKALPQVLEEVSEILEKIVPGIIQHFNSIVDLEPPGATTPFQPSMYKLDPLHYDDGRSNKSKPPKISFIPILFFIFISVQIGFGVYQYFIGTAELYPQVLKSDKIMSHLESILPGIEISNQCEIIKYDKSANPGDYIGYTDKAFFYSQSGESARIPFSAISSIKTSIWGVYKDIKIIVEFNKGKKVLFLPRFDKKTIEFFNDLEQFLAKNNPQLNVNFNLFGFF